MLTIARQFVDDHDGDVAAAAVAFAHGLMRGDPASHKIGYSADNAAIATAEAFDFDADSDELLELCTEIDADDDLVMRCLRVPWK